MEHTIVVSATAESSTYAISISLCWMHNGEYFRDKGEDALIVYVTYQNKLLHIDRYHCFLKGLQGKAYPGDVFYLHSRLLRGLRVNADYVEQVTGGKVKGKTGSLTALPLLKLWLNVSVCSTNVISITDGQIYLETELCIQA